MKRFNMRQWLRDRAAGVAIDESLLQQSRTARASKRFIQASMIVHVLTPVLVILGIITLTALPVLAQSPGRQHLRRERSDTRQRRPRSHQVG